MDKHATTRPHAQPDAPQLTPREVLRWTRVGMLAALAIILGYLETFVPIPIPGVKLGLANIAVLIALGQHDARGAFGIAVIKVLASGLLFGSPVMMAYSATGTLLAFVVMAPLAPLPTMHIVMVSVVGALAHEIGQLLVAMLLLGTPLVWYSAPLLEVAGCVTGALCGIVAARTIELLERGEELAKTSSTRAASASPAQPAPTHATASLSSRAAPAHAISPGSAQPPHRGPSRDNAKAIDARAALVTFLAFTVFVLHASSPTVLGVALACACVVCVASRVRMRDIGRALRPLVFIVAITFVAQVINAQQGAIVATIGPITITREALVAACVMVERLLVLTAASLAVMHLVSTDGLILATDWLLSPLKRLGLRTDGFVLALRTALRLVPEFAETLSDNSELLRSKLLSRELWTTVFPQIIARLYLAAGVE
jgi:heptaprenyl diphosphate synthase